MCGCPSVFVVMGGSVSANMTVCECVGVWSLWVSLPFDSWLNKRLHGLFWSTEILPHRLHVVVFPPIGVNLVIFGNKGFLQVKRFKVGKGGGGKRDDRRFFVHLFRRSCILSAWSEIRLNLPVLVYHQGWQGAVLTQERRSTLADQIKAIPAPRRHTHQPWPWDSDVVICRFLQHPTSLTESAAESSADVVSQPHGGQDSPGLWELLCFLNGILKTFPDIDASVTSL